LKLNLYILALAAGSDYSPINTTMTFTSGTSEQCAHISILL